MQGELEALERGEAQLSQHSTPPSLPLQPLLDTLNLCKNRISSLQTATLAPLAGSLRTLLLGHNELAAVEDLAPLACLLQLEVLDLQCNRLCDGAGTLRVLAALPRLAVLHLQGNPLVAATPHYRRSALGALTALAYLDERPVFPAERAGANAAERALRAGGGPEEAAAAEREALAADLAARREEERARSAAWGEFVRRAQAARGVAQEEKGAQRVSAGPEAQGCPSDEDSVELSTGAAEPGAFRDTGDARTRSLSAGEEVPALSTGDSTASMELSTRRDNGSRSLSPQASTAEQQGDKAHDAVATMTEALQGFAFKKGPGGSA